MELDDGTPATATASADLMEEVGLGPDVLNQTPIELYTWSTTDIYLIFQDSDPDRVVLEETSTGEWTAVSVEQ